MIVSNEYLDAIQKCWKQGGFSHLPSRTVTREYLNCASSRALLGGATILAVEFIQL